METMTPANLVTLAVSAFVCVTSFVLLLSLLPGLKRSQSGAQQSRTMPGDEPIFRRIVDVERPSNLQRMGKILAPEDTSRINRLVARLQQAGLYQRHAMGVYLGLKFLLLVVPLGAGLALHAADLLTLNGAILLGVGVGLGGLLVSSAWLNYRKRERQRRIRRSVPDALDVMVVCLEGGLSLPGALARVASELGDAHPLLAHELGIVRREIQLGCTTGEALRHFAQRFDLEELRSLSSVVLQAERFGASVVRALQVHADTLRLKRHQDAETMAQKAPVKLIFPTVFCIFPSLYIVLMGPAIIELLKMIERL